MKNKIRRFGLIDLVKETLEVFRELDRQLTLIKDFIKKIFSHQ